jgi:hypothetical protein
MSSAVSRWIAAFGSKSGSSLRAQHGELRGQTQTAGRRDSGELTDNATSLEIAHAPVLVARDELGGPALKLIGVVTLELGAEVLGDRRGVLAIAFAHRDEELQEAVLHLGCDASHHSEIDQCESSIVGDHDVAGMGIGVEEPVNQDLVEIRRKQRGGEPWTFHLHECKRTHRAEIAPWDVVHRQDRVRRVVGDGLGNDYARVFRQVVAQHLEVGRLLPIVEFGHERALELFDHVGETEPAPRIRVVIGELGDCGDGLHVGEDVSTDVRALNLDGHRAPIAECCSVDLAEGGRGEGLGVEARECLGEADAELLGDDSFDLFDGKGVDLVLEAAQRGEVGRR